MSLAFMVPTLAVVGLSVLLGFVRWPLAPRAAVVAVTVLVAVGGGVVAALLVTAMVGFLAELAGATELPGWCGALFVDHPVSPVEGAVATGAVLVGAFRVRRLLSRRRAAIAGTTGRRIAILQTAEPVAYAAPGRPGCVVVSTGLLAGLEPRERQAVFAHERAHLEQRHDRFLLIGAVAQAIVPVLAPLVDRLRLATERCADEAAVRALGGDRRTVATAIGKAAMTTTAFQPATAGFTGGPVVARVEALIGAPPSRAATLSRYAATAIGAALVLGAGSVQLHHLWLLVEHVCG